MHKRQAQRVQLRTLNSQNSQPRIATKLTPISKPVHPVKPYKLRIRASRSVSDFVIPDVDSELMKIDKLKVIEDAIKNTTIDFTFKEEQELRISKQCPSYRTRFRSFM